MAASTLCRGGWPPEGGRFQSFPRNGWRREIEQARRIGLRGIEWIYDRYGEARIPSKHPMAAKNSKHCCSSTGRRWCPFAPTTSWTSRYCVVPRRKTGNSCSACNG